MLTQLTRVCPPAVSAMALISALTLGLAGCGAAASSAPAVDSTATSDVVTTTTTEPEPLLPSYHATLSITGAKSVSGKFNFQPAAEGQTCETRAASGTNGTFDLPRIPDDSDLLSRLGGRVVQVAGNVMTYAGPGTYGKSQVWINNIDIDKTSSSDFNHNYSMTTTNSKVSVTIDEHAGGSLSATNMGTSSRANELVNVSMTWTCSMEKNNPDWH